jgi:hypothetical protein
MNDARNDRPIIVLGCPRSGTTLVQVMLHSHPRIAIPPETRFLLAAYNRRLGFGDLRRWRNRRRLARFIVRKRSSRFKDLGLDRQSTISAILHGPPTLGSALGIVLRGYAERFGRERWGDKRPYYHQYVEVILRLFPDAQLVYLVRDPRDCVASLKRMSWWKRDSYHSIAVWAESIDHLEEATRRWPDAIVPVQYERLVAEPEYELKILCASLGEEYDPAMAEPEAVAAIAVPERKHWHRQTRVPPTTARVGRGLAELEPWELALCDTLLAERMQRHGYELTGTGRASVRHVARFAEVRAARRLFHAKWQFQDRRRRRREANPVAAVLTSAQLRQAGVFDDLAGRGRLA